LDIYTNPRLGAIRKIGGSIKMVKKQEMKKASLLFLTCVALSIGGTGSGSAQDWPMFRHDLQHTGYSTSRSPLISNLLWEYPTGRNVYSSPAVVNGKVFIGSNDHNVYCLDESSGSLIWSYLTQGAVKSSPAVVNGKVFVGSFDHNVYCLRAPSTRPRQLDVAVWRWSPEVEVDEALVGAIAEFEESQWEESHVVEINLIRIPSQPSWENLMTLLASGSLPTEGLDVLWVGVDQAMVSSLRGHIMELDYLVRAQPELIEGIPDTVLDHFRYNDHLYGIPLGTAGESALHAYAISSAADSGLATELILLLRSMIPPSG